MVGGWVFAILLLVLMNFLRKRRNIASIKATVEEAGEQEESKPDKKPKKKEEKTVKAHKLQSNECRMTPDTKLSAHSVKQNLAFQEAVFRLQVFLSTM